MMFMNGASIFILIYAAIFGTLDTKFCSQSFSRSAEDDWIRTLILSVSLSKYNVVEVVFEISIFALCVWLHSSWNIDLQMSNPSTRESSKCRRFVSCSSQQSRRIFKRIKERNTFFALHFNVYWNSHHLERRILREKSSWNYTIIFEKEGRKSSFNYCLYLCVIL